MAKRGKHMVPWRAAGGVCQVELEGIGHILANDGTAVVTDTRESAEFQKGTLRFVLGPDAAAARYVAEALSREAFHNVSYFAGPLATVQRSLTQ